MPSLALRTATSRPRIWVLKRSEIARPAASSLALLMRRPEDRRWMVVARLEPLVDRLRCAFSDITLVLMTCAISVLLGAVMRIQWAPRGGGGGRCARVEIINDNPQGTFRAATT